MSPFARLVLPAVAFVVLAGCMPQGGILLTPVPVNKELDETVVRSDPGLFVADKIAVVEVEGIIIDAQTGPLLGQKENPVSLFAEKLDKAAADPAVKALLIRINSPGGTVSGSDIMHRKLLEFRRCRPDVPVAASILDIGASGGYYIACGAQNIYALPTTITGSIGVIFQTFSIAGTLGKIGVTTEAIKSGRNKDIASPLHDLTEDERRILTGIVMDFYEEFLRTVLAGRPKLTRQTLAPLADGRVFTGAQAKQVGLVDELLYPEQVLVRLKQQAALERVKVVMYHRPSGYRANVYSSASAEASGGGATVNLLNVDLPSSLRDRQPRFMYLWTMP